MAIRFDCVKRDAWCKRLAKYESSKLTVAEFCRREEVSQASFYYWAKRIRQAGNSEDTPGHSADACPAMLRDEVPSDFVEVVVGDSIRVRMPASGLGAVAALVRHLQEASQEDDASMATSRFQRIELTRPATQP